MLGGRQSLQGTKSLAPFGRETYLVLGSHEDVTDTEEGYEGSTVSQKTLTTGLSGGVHATDKKLGRPKAREVGREAGGGASLYQSLKPDPTARQPGAFHGQLKHRWGLHAKGLQTSSKGQRTATGGG